MATSSETLRDAYKAHMAYCKEKPEWIALALECINSWGRQEATLQHAVAMALEDAYERGRQGDYPVHEPPTPTIMRRTRPAPTPAPAGTLVRRRR